MLALVELLSERVLAQSAARLARFLGGSITLAYAAAILILYFGGVTTGIDVVAVRAVGILSWLVAGPVALAAARDLTTADEIDGVRHLLAARGHSPAQIAAARTLAAPYAITRSVGPPSIALLALAVALSPESDVALARANVLAGGVGYVVMTSLVLGVVARWCATLSPSRGRTLFAAVTLGPYVAGLATGEVASIPAWFALVLDRLVDMGGVP